MSEVVLEIHDLHSGYQSRDVLRGISLAVSRGELVTIIGPNGHGKSTLLRTIFGLLPSRKGRVEFLGKPLGGLTPEQIARLGLTYVPQGDALFPDMTVRENLLMGAYLERNAKEALRRLDEVCMLMPKLSERSAQLARCLSGGERRMVGIARAIMASGRLLLIDEPSLGLAPLVTDSIYRLIGRLKNSGRTILLVEENPARVVDMADRLHLLDDGLIAWTGRGQELMSRGELLSTYLGG
jgi:branched-chain amino acid transport system ATP-binding protein